MVSLLTNNPAKVEALRADGVSVTGRVPMHIETVEIPFEIRDIPIP